jgi:hypothetical protein
MKLMVQCGDDMHEVTIHEDRSVTLDPKAHDRELELTLVDLGAEPVTCIALLRDDNTKLRLLDSKRLTLDTRFAVAMTLSREARCRVAAGLQHYELKPSHRYLLALGCDDITMESVAQSALGLTAQQRYDLAMAAEGDRVRHKVAWEGEGLTGDQRFALISAIHDTDLRQSAARIAPGLTDEQRMQLIDDPSAYEEEEWTYFGREEEDTPELDFDF